MQIGECYSPELPVLFAVHVDTYQLVPRTGPKKGEGHFITSACATYLYSFGGGVDGE